MKKILYTLLGMMLSVGAWAQTSLQEQINSATEATTIQLTDDVDLGAYSLVILAAKNITLDLNGHSITSSASGAVAVKNNGTLTVKDTSGEHAGKIISTKYAGIGAGDNSVTTFESGNIESVEGAIITGKVVGATITINGGTLSASDNAVIMGNGSSREGSANTITINGGTFNGGIVSAGYVACGIYAPWKDVITVNCGTFNITGGCGICARAGSVTVNGGEFNCSGTATGKVGDSRVVVPCSAIVYDSQANYPAMTSESEVVVPSASTATFKSEDGVAAVSVVGESHIEISGGTYSSPLTEDVCADGYIPSNTPNADGKYEAKAGTYVAQIGDKKYETIADAIAAATAGQTITLLADQTISSDLTVSAEKNFTLDLNGKVLSLEAKFYNNGTLVVKSSADGGKITRSSTVIYNYSADACFTLESGTLEATGNTTNGVINNKGTLTINGGEVKAKTYAIRTADNSTSTITINGGSISTEGENAIYMQYGKCDITSGTIISTGKNVMLYNTSALRAPMAVTSNAVATLSDGYSYALIGALACANAGETITLTNNSELTTEATVAKTLTLNLNGHNISSTKTALKVTAGTLTIEGEGTIKGASANAKGSKSVFYPAVYANGGDIVINGGTYDDGGVDGYGFPTIYADESSTVTINNGTFKNSATSQGDKYWVLNTKDGSTASIVVKGGSFYNFDPANNMNEGIAGGNGTNYVADGYITEMTESGSDKIYTVKEGQWIAKIEGGVDSKFRFASLDDAISAANGAGKDVTITLLAEATATVEPADNVTIDADGKALTLPTFTVADGAELSYAKVTNATDNTYKVTAATYNRTGAAGTQWGTACLPFSFESAPEGYTLYTPTTVGDNVLNVTEVTYPVAAGTPVIFYKGSAAEATMTMTSSNASVKIDATPVAQSGSLALVGTFSQQTITEGLSSIYFINGDKFHQAKASLTVPAYRAYIKNASAGAKAAVLSIVVDGEATAIEGVATDLNDTQAIYDVNGRQLSAPQKGINIMKLANGKTVKLIIK